MFRELTRKNKQISREECIALLQKEKRGVLSVLGDDGYPYGMPMNHFYHEEDGCLYFHTGKQLSHRLDALKSSQKVSFCVLSQGQKEENDWALHFKSVIVFGKTDIIEDYKTVIAITRKLCHKFTQDQVYIEKEIKESGQATLLLRLTPEHITGKRIKEA